jgi:glycosyltransferase involved in cell wall biosynthesis
LRTSPADRTARTTPAPTNRAIEPAQRTENRETVAIRTKARQEIIMSAARLLVISDNTGLETISVIVPVKNEAENLPPLVDRLLPVLHALERNFEVIIVNDGSTDGSLRVLRELAASHPELRVIDLARNYGQTAAMMAGIDHARGDIIVPIDADLQNDPADIPKLLAKLDEGYDVVSGWRVDRQDAALRRNFVSRVANRVISRVSGVRLHDYGCSLKAYRRSVLGPVRLYGEMHRFVPIFASW